MDKIAEDMLLDFRLSEILEMNDLTDEEVLSCLIESGLIDTERYEVEITENDD